MSRIDTAAERDWLQNGAIAAYRYRYTDPASLAPVWRNSSGAWNDQHPAETERLYCERTARVCHQALDEIDRLRAQTDELDFLKNEGGPNSVSAMADALRWIFEHAADQDISHEVFRVEATARAAATLLSDLEAAAAREPPR